MGCSTASCTEASGGLTVIQDLPIGVDGGGADAWTWQDLLADGVEVGAPPDLFNAAGQDWGSPPLVPWRLREHDYDAVRRRRSARRSPGAGGLRIDHVMGLFRLWWVPPGGSPPTARTCATRATTCSTSSRSRAIARARSWSARTSAPSSTACARRWPSTDLLSYRLLWFEDDDPRDWPAKSMAAVTTHDLPTIAGLWGDVDTDDRRQHSDEDESTLAKQRTDLLAALIERGGIDSDATADDAIVAAYGLLAQAPSRLLSATLDDAVAAERRPNIPGATERENWSIPLPVRIEDLPRQQLAARIANTLRDGLKDPAAHRPPIGPMTTP